MSETMLIVTIVFIVVVLGFAITCHDFE